MAKSKDEDVILSPEEEYDIISKAYGEVLDFFAACDAGTVCPSDPSPYPGIPVNRQTEAAEAKSYMNSFIKAMSVYNTKAEFIERFIGAYVTVLIVDARGKEREVKVHLNEQNCKDIYSLWKEDSLMFNDRYDQEEYKGKFYGEIENITSIFNSELFPRGYKRSGCVTHREMIKLFSYTVFSDTNISMFLAYKEFLKSLLDKKRISDKNIYDNVIALILNFQPTTEDGRLFKAAMKKKCHLYDGKGPGSADESLRQNQYVPSLLEGGFINPFDGESGIIPQQQQDDVMSVYDQSGLQATDFKKIGIWNGPSNSIIYRAGSDGGRMISKTYFQKGDIVETAPITILKKGDLYSRNIRDLVFQLDDDGEIFGLPAGYANCYRKDIEAPTEGNIRYKYDENTNTLVFTAISVIKPGTEIVLKTDAEDFGNQLQPKDFHKYAPGLEPSLSIKSYDVESPKKS